MSPKNNAELPLPVMFLNRFSGANDGIWKKVDYFRADLEEKGQWDKRVFIPYNAWYEFLRRDYPQIKQPRVMVPLTQNLSALGAWRPTQDIVRFDPDLYRFLVGTELGGKLPSHILQLLPAWGLYVEAPGLELSGRTYEGFFVNLDLCNEPGLVLLALHFLDEKLETTHVMLPLGEWSLAEAVERTNEDFRRGAALAGQKVDEKSLLKLEDGLEQALNLLIFICSFGLGNEYVGAGGPGHNSGLPGKKVKGVLRFFPPAAPVIRKLGSEYGRQIRLYEKHARTGSHDSPRPHIRRAHWHGYWSGSLKEEAKKPRKFSVRWLPPIPVGWFEDESPDDETGAQQADAQGKAGDGAKKA